MDCERFIDQLGDDAGAADAAVIPLRQHLASCLRCRRMQRALLRGLTVLRSLPSANVSSDFFERLQHRLDRVERRRRVGRMAVTLGSVGCAAAAAFLLVFGPREMNGPWARVARDPGQTALPSVTLVRPFAALLGAEEGGMFEGSLAGEIERVAMGWTDPGALGWTGPVLESTAISGPPAYGRPPVLDRQPVLYAAPSWTFVAAPVSFRFVSATATTIFPTRSR